jgi:N-acetyl-anhydromuramyl-L-alanine amidase AmpD
VTPQDIKYVVVHCSATPPTMDVGRTEIDRWHRQKGWLMIGYHFVIRRDGTVEAGRMLNAVGAHAINFNENSWGICLVGGVNADGHAVDNFTPAQMAMLKKIVVGLLKDAPKAEVLGHRDLPQVKKDCPSFDVRSWWRTVNA